MTVPELMSDAQTGVGTPAEQREMSPCAAEEGGEGGAGEGVAAAPATVPGEPGLGGASGPHGSNGNGQESDAGRHTSDAGVPTPVEGQSEGAGDVGKGAGVPPVADQPGGDYPAEEQPPPVAPASVAVPASGACSTAKPPVAPASAMSPRVGVVPPKYADGKAVVSKYSLPRHSNGAKALSLQAALGATPNHQALLDSPVLLPMVAVSQALLRASFYVSVSSSTANGNTDQRHHHACLPVRRSHPQQQAPCRRYSKTPPSPWSLAEIQ